MSCLVLALAPAAAILWWIYTRDRDDPEPQGLVAATIALGAASTVSAIILELLGQFTFLPDRTGEQALGFASALATGLYIGVVEEGGKLLAVLLVAFRHRAFNQRMDGIVYCVAASLGFAALENLLYVGAARGLLGTYATGLTRAVTAVPGHAAFGVLMGAFLGAARMEPKRRTALILLGYIVASVAHGLYDAVLFTRTWAAWLVLPILAGCIALGIASIHSARKRDGARSAAFWGWRKRIDEAAHRGREHEGP
jgi:protease PrsW